MISKASPQAVRDGESQRQDVRGAMPEPPGYSAVRAAQAAAAMPGSARTRLAQDEIARLP
jgi:hypothetical protein